MDLPLEQSVALASAWAGSWSAYALSMLWQTAMVVAVVWILDRLLRRRSATFRHALWMLVLVRLMLPPDLSLPTGMGTWAAPLLNKVRSSVPVPQAAQTASAQSAMISGTPRWARTGSADSMPGQSAAMNSTFAASAFDSPIRPAPQPGWIDQVSLPMAFFVIWLVGAVVLSGLTAIRHFRLRRHLAEATPIEDQEIYEIFVKCRARIGLSTRQKIQLCSSSEISGPMVTGALRTRLMLPDLLMQVCSREELEGLILHELAHVKRRDLMINWLQIAIQIVHWFNPLVWYVNFRIKQLREEACDDQVVSLANSNRSYAAGLIKVLEFSTPGDPVYSGHAGALEKESFIARRLARIMDRERKVHAHLTLLRGLALVALGAIILPMMPPSDSSATSLSDRALQAERDSLLADLGALQNRNMDFCLMLDSEEPKVEGCSATQRFSKDIWFDPNGVINMDLESENVSISGWDEPKLRIVMTKTVQLHGSDHHNKQPKDNLRRIRYSLSRMKNMINLEGRTPEEHDGLKYSVHYEIVAPRSTLLNVSTESGIIQARELQAMLNLRTESGKIRLTSIDGIVNAEAGGCGGIDARQLAGNMTLRSMGGTVAVEEVEGNILLRNDEGGIEARSVVGNAKLFTGNGAISLEDVSGDIYAQSNDGEMRISNVVGKFTARTDDGNIQISRKDSVLADEKIAVFSNGGTIRVNIPTSSSADFKVEAAKEIQSEFAAQAGATERRIAGTIGKGGAEITLKSTEGSIALLKL